MNTTALAIIEPQELDTIQRTAKLLAASGYFGTMGDATTAMAQVAAKILAGRELGFGPFAAVNGIHIIQGKPTIGANLMAAAVRSHPRYDYRVVQLTDKVCELEFLDGGKPAGMSRFTIEEAATANLSTGKNQDTWKKYPRNMLFARAMSNGVRWYAPDIFSGNTVYVPEELDVAVDGEGNVVDASYTVTKPLANVQEDVNFDKQPPVDNPFTDIAPELAGARLQFHALGEEVYGEKWPVVRKRNVSRITSGVTYDADALTVEQLQKLTAGMETVKSRKAETVAA